MQIDSITLTAGRRTPIAGPFKFFMLIDAPAPVTVQFFKNGSPARETANDVESGFISKPGNWSDPEDRFDGYVLTSATGQTVRVGVSDREGDYKFAASLVSIQAPNGFSTIADQTVQAAATIEVPSNSNRRALYVENIGTANCRVGDSNVAVGRGQRLKPGMTAKFTATDDLYAIQDGAAGAILSILEETRS